MTFVSKYIKRACILVAAPLLLASCSEDVMDDINKDINHTQSTQAKFILADVITSTAFNNVGGSINTYTAAYVEHEVGTHNQLFRAEHRQGEPSTSSTFNNPWGSLYSAYKHAKIVIDKCSPGGAQEGNDVTKGMAEVLAAYNLALITDMFGDAPFSEAGDYTVSMTPRLDKQQAIYEAVHAYLDAAIVDLQKSDAHVTGGPREFDLLYQGNASKWLKFAYGLKARYTMRLMNRSTNVNADMEKVIEYTQKSFTSADEQAAFSVYNATNLNPLFDFQWSRDGLAASRSLADKLIERNDPRLRRVFTDAGWSQLPAVEKGTDEYELMAPNGQNIEQQYVYNTSTFVYSQTAPTLMMSYHEVLFLQAEAMHRLGKSVSEIEGVVKKAVVAAIANSEIGVKAAFVAPNVLNYGGISETTEAITTEEAAAYFEQQVKPLLKANTLKEIINQKYLAFFGASGESTECYSDIRRLRAAGDDLVTLVNPNDFPIRLPYGNDDTTTNPHVKEAYGNGQYVYTEPVWWAGGNR